MYFYFYRIVIRDITGIPLCPITQLGYTQEMCSCCVRIGIFHLLIQDWIRFQTRSNDFNMYEAYLQFSRVYMHLNPVSAFFASRPLLNKIEERPSYVSTQWINTNEDNICAHCYRIFSFCLCIDDYSDFAHDQYLKQIPCCIIVCWAVKSCLTYIHTYIHTENFIYTRILE